MEHIQWRTATLAVGHWSLLDFKRKMTDISDSRTALCGALVFQENGSASANDAENPRGSVVAPVE